MMNAVRHEIWATDNTVALTLTGTLEGYIRQFTFAGPRFGFLLMSIFGGIGLMLVTIGVYSVLAYTAARRTHEMGIRMALGAEGGDVLKLVIAMGLKLVALGVVIGVNLQTSFLTPPFGFALFYLRGVAPPEIKTADIYRGVVPFIALQVLWHLLF